MMPRTRAPYPKEFREQIVALVRAGRTPQELAREFEPSEQTIRTWIKQAQIDGGERQDGPTTEEKQELARLRKEVRQLRVERDILAKAAAWFARETGSVPPKSSSS
jgi:transposase